MVAQVDWLKLQVSCFLAYQRQKPAARCDRRERRRGNTPEKYQVPGWDRRGLSRGGASEKYNLPGGLFPQTSFEDDV